MMYVGLTVWGYIVEGRQRRSLARLFGTYVPPELVAEMALDPARYDMRAENRELTVMFCDMRNFTRVSELMSPQDLRALINGFFSSMTTAIRGRRGTLDKYIGDAIMAFWGAPVMDEGHAANAVRASLEMVGRLEQLNADLRARALPEIGVGIGLNTGLVCVGDMGSSMRRSYTVMGDAVNLASRIESLTRHYGVDVLAGEATRSAAHSDEWRWVEVDRVRVKGKQRAVTLFTPVSCGAERTLNFDEELRLWQLALTSCRLQHWDETLALLNGLQTDFADSPLQGLYRQLHLRATQFRSTPPAPDWDGAHTFDTK
jgi:adenylate cyclase